jgi:hypothetical protein
MASQFLGSTDITFTALQNLHTNMCSGVQGSWYPQDLPSSLGLMSVCLGGGCALGVGLGN